MRRRDWADARAKVEEEGSCRISPRCQGHIEAAHVIGRVNDERKAERFYVNPDSVVPLCGEHHRAYDAHTLDLLPYLTLKEQIRAVRDAGGLEQARVRTVPSEYRKVAA